MRWHPLFWSSPSPRCAFSSLLLTSLPLPYSSTRALEVVWELDVFVSVCLVDLIFGDIIIAIDLYHHSGG